MAALRKRAEDAGVMADPAHSVADHEDQQTRRETIFTLFKLPVRYIHEYNSVRIVAHVSPYHRSEGTRRLLSHRRHSDGSSQMPILPLLPLLLLLIKHSHLIKWNLKTKVRFL